MTNLSKCVFSGVYIIDSISAYHDSPFVSFRTIEWRFSFVLIALPVIENNTDFLVE